MEMLFTGGTINKRFLELVQELYQIYSDEEVVFIYTLKKRTVFFACNLLKKL